MMYAYAHETESRKLKRSSRIWINVLLAVLLFCTFFSFYMPFIDVKRFWDRAKNGGRKSFRFEEIDQSYELHPRGGFTVPYLDMLQVDLDRREES